MKKEIWLDMDGTIADLYGVDNWLEYLKAEDEKPYKIAKPLVNMKNLAKELKQTTKAGLDNRNHNLVGKEWKARVQRQGSKSKTKLVRRTLERLSIRYSPHSRIWNT
jgi:hypothetical protein